MFPLDALQKANPNLNPEMLHPGVIVRMPYVPLSEFERQRTTNQLTERRLAETRARLAELERDRASFETQRAEVARSQAALPAVRGAMTALGVLAIVLLGLVVYLGAALRAARRARVDVASRYEALQSRYDGLRASLQEVDLGVQRRVLSLLKVHGASVVSDSELANAIKPVVDFTHELRKKHKTA